MIYYDRTTNKYYTVRCPFCKDFQHVTRNGRQYNGIYRYKCPSCMKSFQDIYVSTGFNLRLYFTDKLPISCQISKYMTNY